MNQAVQVGHYFDLSVGFYIKLAEKDFRSPCGPDETFKTTK